ncbi:hypothetical protein V1506DRAFT_534738 [Lipomyces tetrasporus]
MSFFHPSSHPLNPFGSGPHPQHPPFFPITIPPPPGLAPPPSPLQRSTIISSPSRKSVTDDPSSPVKSGVDGARKKIYVRTDEEQFALPMSKVETNEDLVILLSRLFSPDILHRLQIRYDTTVVDAKGNPAGPISGGAVIYPEYWESLIEDGMRIMIKVLSEDGELSSNYGGSVSESSRILSQSSSSTSITETSRVISGVTEQIKSSTAFTSAAENERSTRHQHTIPPIGPPTNKENDSLRADELKPRTYSSAVKQTMVQPLGVSTNLVNTTKSSSRAIAPQHLQQVVVMPEDTSSLQPQKIFRPGRMSAMTPAEAALKSVTDPYGLTYQSCITLLAPLLPDYRRLTHPRLSPNIVTIRPCHENTLWIFCVIQRTLHPVTVRAFETIDIEELMLRVVPPEIGKEKAVVLWRNMKFGGEAIGGKYNAKKETRGTGGRNMWKRNLAVLAVKNAEVFVVVFETPQNYHRHAVLSQQPGVIDLTAEQTHTHPTTGVGSSSPTRVPFQGISQNYPGPELAYIDYNTFQRQQYVQKYSSAISATPSAARINAGAQTQLVSRTTSRDAEKVNSVSESSATAKSTRTVVQELSSDTDSQNDNPNETETCADVD